MIFSSNGAAKLREWENKDGKPALVAYLDNAGHFTIGTGHVKGVKRGDTCTLDQAIKWEIEDTQECVMCINRNVHVDLTQNEFDALVIFIFNVGVSAFLKSTALKKLNAGDYDGCGQAMQMFNKITIDDPKNPGKKIKVVSTGLVNRRAKELILWTQDFVSNANGADTPTAPPVKVSATTTGKMQFGALAASAAAAITEGLSTVQPVIDAGKSAIGSVGDLNGTFHTIGIVLVVFSIGFTILTLWHKSQNMDRAL